MQSYQLFINVTKEINLQVGKLGKFIFPVGSYVYTGSAKKNIDKRIERHLSKKKISIGTLIIYLTMMLYKLSIQRNQK